MKTIRKILSLLIAIVMTMGTVLVPKTASAAEEETTQPTTNLVIHKLQADSYNTDTYDQENFVEGKGWKHDGTERTDLQDLGTNVRELDGVTFTYYSVTDEELQTMVANPSEYSTIDNTLGTKEGEIITANGQGATIALPAGNYWFVESDKPDTVSSSLAVPFGISLPLTNKAGTGYLDTVHVYPKNVTGEEPEPDKTVNDLTNKYSSHEIGEVQTWYLQATIPANIKDYGTLKMTDEFSKSLTYKGNDPEKEENNVVVKYGNADTFDGLTVTLVENTDYEIKQPDLNSKGGTLEISLTKTGIAKLAENYVKGGKLVASVKTVINEDAIMGLDIPNGYTLTFNNNPNNEGEPKEKEVPKEKEPKVVSGGKRFIKVDGDKKALENAVFQVYDGEDAVNWTTELITANKEAINTGKFAIKNGENYEATSGTKQPSNGQPIYLRSDKDGNFEIKGLEFSSWTKQKWDANKKELVDGETVTHEWNVKEVQAPEGYAILDKAIPFTVDKVSYFKDPTDVEVVPSDPQEVENKSLTIPQTGGIGSIIFVVAGLMLMGLAAYKMKANKEEA
ncbi:MAG: SpaH/EbpB family LPXTG-anchored major pilin [Anaerococcus sp.]|nr:SpaH/EbpB family LPXTG-anchored major pilin [Peptoniphilaceae bacterium]MDY3055566.1 SpaH/EbpB family LPXTG-anchored major pilin [Anaerococcus sp.]